MNNMINNVSSTFNLENTSDLKICSRNISSECLKISNKNRFRGTVCLPCANHIQLSNKKELTYKLKLNELQKLGLNKNKTERLCNLLHLSQCLEFTKILLEKSDIEEEKTIAKLNVV